MIVADDFSTKTFKEYQNDSEKMVKIESEVNGAKDKDKEKIKTKETFPKNSNSDQSFWRFCRDQKL